MQKIVHKSVHKGDVWLIENIQALGHVQKGVRPHVARVPQPRHHYCSVVAARKSNFHKKLSKPLSQKKESFLCTDEVNVVYC